MYAEIKGERYALDSVITRKAVNLVFSDTPIDTVDEIACNLPDTILVYSDGELIYEFTGFTRAVRLEKNVSNKKVLLGLERGCNEHCTGA